eukprot:gene26951-33139_t
MPETPFSSSTTTAEVSNEVAPEAMVVPGSTTTVDVRTSRGVSFELEPSDVHRRLSKLDFRSISVPAVTAIRELVLEHSAGREEKMLAERMFYDTAKKYREHDLASGSGPPVSDLPASELPSPELAGVALVHHVGREVAAVTADDDDDGATYFSYGSSRRSSYNDGRQQREEYTRHSYALKAAKDIIPLLRFVDEFDRCLKLPVVQLAMITPCNVPNSAFEVGKPILSVHILLKELTQHCFPTPSSAGTELRGVLVDSEEDHEMATLGSFLRRVRQTRGRLATPRKVREFWDGLHLAHRVVSMLATHELTTPVPETDLLDVFLSGLGADVRKEAFEIAERKGTPLLSLDRALPANRRLALERNKQWRAHRPEEHLDFDGLDMLPVQALNKSPIAPERSLVDARLRGEATAPVSTSQDISEDPSEDEPSPRRTSLKTSESRLPRKASQQTSERRAIDPIYL